MSIECGICESDLRSGHAKSCPRHPENKAPVQPLKQWKVVRNIREEFCVEAGTKAEALLNIQDPHTVTVTKQTCVRA